MRIILLALLVSLHVIGWGQEIGGVVDISNYYKVTGIDFNKSIITVSNAQGLSRGDRILIIQMKGATITPSNNASSGATSGQVASNAYGGAGTYEIADVCRVSGNQIVLVHDLKNTTYNFQIGKVQVVKFLKYESVTVTSTLEPSPWNGETGGVLAINVSGNLQLSANITADGKGFIGGAYQETGDLCYDNIAPDFYYDPTPVTVRNLIPPFVHPDVQYGARKGESIVDLSLAYQGGKAAVGNGGGGGNNHNNGGGGGSNLSIGGVGGGNASSGSGSCQGNHPGQGGYALNSNNGTRIFLGGGGGAGHSNNPQVSKVGGGNGGGIILIEAGTLITTVGKKISSNGLEGSSTLGDGASGGGGAGSIILNVGTYSGSVNIEAKGGRGGTENEVENPTGRCFGEGGGGSGGVIYFKGPQPAGSVSVTGGDKGDKPDSECPNTRRAAAGSAGLVIPNYTYVRSTELSSTCPEGAATLPVVILSFKVTHKGALAKAEWKIAHPEDAVEYILQRKTSNGDWSDIYTIRAEERTTHYQKGDGPLATGIYLYRLKIVEKDRSVSYSTIQQITIKAEDVDRLTIHPNPATSEITIVTPVQNEEWLNIYDMKSRLVHRRKVAPNSAQIKQDISFLSEGIYMIRIGKYTARFVVFK